MKKINIGFNTIFSRILFFNTFLVILITLIPQLFFTNYFVKNYDNQKNQYNMQLVKQAQNYIDDMVIEKIVNITNTYFSELDSNYDLTYPLDNDISHDSVMISNVLRRLSNIASVNNFISNINIYYTKSNMIFSISGISYVGDEAFSKSFPGNEKLMDTFSNINGNVDWLSSVQLMNDTTPSSAIFVRTLPYVSSKDSRQAVLAIGFNEAFFYNFIESIKFQEDGMLFILGEEGNIVLSSNSDQNGTKLQSTEMLNKIMSIGKEGRLKEKVDGKESIISFSKSKYNNWRYVSIVSVDSYYKKSTQIRNITLTFGLLLLFFNVMFSVLLTRTAHKPLLKILNGIRGSAKNVSANANEYNLLENTYKGLSETVEELNSKLEESKPIIRHNTILKLLKGRIGSFESNTDEQEFVNIKFSANRVVCFILNLFYNNEINLNPNLSFENKMLIEYNIIDILERNKEFNIIAVIDDTGYFTAIVNHAYTIDAEYVVSKILSIIDEVLSIQYVLCCGNDYNVTVENINKSYREAVDAFKFSFIKCNNKVVKYSELNTEEMKVAGIPKKSLNKLEEYIKSCNEEELQITIHDIIEDLVEGNYTIDFCKNILMDMVTVVRITLINLGYDEKELFDGDLRDFYNRIENINKFEEWFKGVCSSIIKNINSKKEHIGKELELKIINYIQNNIFMDLSLESVADGLYISPGYLSKIFKIAFGMNFTEYVVKLKMEEALKLLHENKLTIKDISNKLGYNSVQYFIRIFKEKYGQTPKEYQKNFQA